MPNRILREGILTSERVNALSWPAEVFYRRLMSAVDDFGRFWAKPDLLRAALYPLQLDKVGNQDAVKWLTECVRAGLVRAYTVEKKEYLQLLDFRQQVRAQASKFPHPPDDSVADDTQALGECIAPAHVGVVEDERRRRGKAARARATPIPEPFEISGRVKTWAEQKGFSNLNAYLEFFRGRMKANGKIYTDWDEALMNCIREDWPGLRKGNGSIPAPEVCAECHGSLAGGKTISNKGWLCNPCWEAR